MALKKKLTTAPDAALAGYYKQLSPSEWVLDLEDDGAPAPQTDESAARLREMRENNIAQAKRIKELEAQSSQVAPAQEQARTLTERLAQIEKTLNEERSARDAAEKRARQESFRCTFVSATNSHKVRDDLAGKALYTMASAVFREEQDGTYRPYDGDKPLYSRVRGKEAEPMGVDEWVGMQREGSLKDLFSQPVGGGGRGSSAAGGAARVKLTQAQVSRPTKEQLAVMQSGEFDLVD